LESEITNQEVASKVGLQNDDFLARIQSAQARALERRKAAFDKNLAQEKAIILKTETRTEEIANKTAANINAANTENNASIEALNDDLANRSRIELNESNERLMAVTNEGQAYIDYLRLSAANKNKYEIAIDNAKIESEKQIFTAQSKALDMQVESNAYVQAKQDNTRYMIARDNLAFDLSIRAKHAYHETWIDVARANLDAEMAGANQLQVHTQVDIAGG
jgi:hypothetical protein